MSIICVFYFCLEAVDIAFRQTRRRFRNMQEGKVYNSEKHKLHEYKFDIFLRLKGVATAFSKHVQCLYPISLFCRKGLKLTGYACKRVAMMKMWIKIILRRIVTDLLGILMDKGYQSAADVLRAIILKKKPLHGVLLRNDLEY